ncbi:hypothetical protein [Bacillus alkalicellulosilyticus]|uniref:hypothetical protein n=1 Tax=Alkalihalobacterium alkalicellulosilyticum TaxID=1912214 RepID=UPI00099860C1|nr:hypothetical protein [Bacillus alkalicellulosilyticus]
MLEKKRKLFFRLSVICILIGIATWIPNFILEYGYSYWLLTFIINPLGIIFGILGRSIWTVIANIIMTFSFFILMYVGYLFNVAL